MDEGPIVITGAGGFVGSALVAHFSGQGRRFRAVVRKQDPSAAPLPQSFHVCDLFASSDARIEALTAGAAAVVHLAGRAHVLREVRDDPVAAYAAANVAVTERVARAAARTGVRRFVLASTIKVNGESSEPGRPFVPDDPPDPRDDYARSKWKAEQALAAAASGTSMAALVLRLPLVYGPRVKANFALLLDEVARGRLLPLAAIPNLRSVLFVGNLVEAIDTALRVPTALSGVHFVTDRESVSTPGLVEAAGVALETPARLFGVPVPVLRVLGAMGGRSAKVRRLVDTLEADSTSFTTATGWRPRHTLAEGLAVTAAWWRMRHSI